MLENDSGNHQVSATQQKRSKKKGKKFMEVPQMLGLVDAICAKEEKIISNKTEKMIKYKAIQEEAEKKQKARKLAKKLELKKKKRELKYGLGLVSKKSVQKVENESSGVTKKVHFKI